MQFALLGAVQARSSDDVVIALGPPQRRAVLAVLLLASGQAVATAALRDRLWGESAPASAVSAIQVHVHHLRKALSAEGGPPVVTYPGHPTDQVSYGLSVSTRELDTTRFRSLLEAGRAAQSRGDASGAVARLDEALALWRGHPLPELRSSPFAVATRHALSDLRLDAVKRRAACLLDLGAATEATADLFALHTEHPGDEQTITLLSSALCRIGARPRALHLLTTELDRWQQEYGLRPAALLRERERVAGSEDTG